MKDSTRDKICKSPQYVQKKANIAFVNNRKRKSETEIISPYTHIIAQKYFQS